MKLIEHKLRMVIYLIILLPLFYTSCDKKEIIDINEEEKENIDSIKAAKETIKLVNEFIYKRTSTFYLWADKIPAGIDYKTYDDPAKLFDDMYYPTLDHWSFVTGKAKQLSDDLNGKRKAAGFRFRPFLYPNSQSDVYFLVMFVYPDGSAYKAGLRRGDLILKVDGNKITADNYNELLNNDVLNLSIGKLENQQVVDANKSITVTKVEQDFSPIIKHKVITKNSKKIGYFLFDQFISKYDKDMLAVIQSFKNEGVTDLVLDLRFNSGGYVSTCAALGSSLVSASDAGKIFLTYHWNSQITNSYKNNPKYDHLFKKEFPKSPVNLDVKNLYVLSSKSTASASEAIVNCLRPYTNVVLIGDTTAGKYTAVNVFEDDNDPPKHNWAIFLVTSRIANVDGVTDYVNGLVPDYLVMDNLVSPLGDENEPLFAKAIELITGSQTAKSATTSLPDDWKMLDDVSEKSFEKEGLLINDDYTLKLKVEN